MTRTSIAALAAVGALAATLLAPAGAAASTPVRSQVGVPAAKQQACADVVFFGLRGSGQGPIDHRGYGPQVWYAMDGIKKRVTDLSYASFPVEYPAEGVEILNPTKGQVVKGLPLGIYEWRKTNAARYFASIASGVGALGTMVDLRGDQCPDESIVLLGYSQGAAAVHQFLNRVEDDGDLDLLDRIAAVVLIADPDRVAESAATNFGTAPSGAQGVEAYQGSGQTSWLKMPGPRRDIPADVSDRTVSVCNKRDTVCDFAPSTLLTAWSIGNKIHSKYIEAPQDNVRSPAVADAIGFIADQL